MPDVEFRYRWDLLWVDADGQWFAEPCQDRSEMNARARHATHRRFEWPPAAAVEAHVGPLVRRKFDVGAKAWVGQDELERGDDWSRPLTMLT